MTGSIRAQAIAWIAVIAIPAALAQQPPNSLLNDSIAPGARLSFKPAPELRMGPMRVVPEETKLESLGLQTVNVLVRHFRRPGAASGNFQWLCFTVTTGPVPQRIWFTSDDEMGSGSVTGILSTVIDHSEKPTEACLELQKRFLPISLEGGVWLGSTPVELKRSLGIAPDVQEGWFGYSYTAPVTLRVRGREEQFDLGNSLEVRIHKGAVASIRISQVTSS